MLWTTVILSLREIRRHLLRSFLTVLGVVIGVAAVVTMTSVGLGAQKMVEDQISSMGSNMIIVQPGNSRGPGGFVNQGAGANISLESADGRAIVTNPAVLLADEPTGNLDSERSVEIMELLTDLNRNSNITVLMVTHEADMASFARTIVHFKDGLVERIENKQGVPA